MANFLALDGISINLDQVTYFEERGDGIRVHFHDTCVDLSATQANTLYTQVYGETAAFQRRQQDVTPSEELLLPGDQGPITFKPVNTDKAQP